MGTTITGGALRFVPHYQERVWGGRSFGSVLGRNLPSAHFVGESWEAVDRHDLQSFVQGGVWNGMDLHTLWTKHRNKIFGNGWPDAQRFPLLLKLLDARECLSVQVHPPEAACARGLGEPKTEWWYVVDAAPEAAVFAGFRPGVTRPMVEEALLTGDFEPLLHKIPVRAGDSLFVPAGRIHAIGAGCLIAEVQQNSDTTFRVFDWNRKGVDGAPRELHIEQSLACIDFEDFTPSLCADLRSQDFSCEFFSVSGVRLEDEVAAGPLVGAFFLVVQGSLRVGSECFRRGDWFLLPEQARSEVLSPLSKGVFLLRVSPRI